ncbi:hypothetical protein BGW39_006487 [Mortierella sp. 14UC]|nr:hypothetical protein BGW39_006487 [Mortierella sp. 14UC]
MFTSWNDAKIFSIGPPDYLQRWLLKQPGVDRIVSLRVPVHRLWTFQRRQDRAAPLGGGWKVKASKKQQQQQQRAGLLSDGEGDRKESDDGRQDLDESNGNPCNITTQEDESSRPYCFTLNKLVNLRRIDITHISDSDIDWETLERALFAIEYGDDSGVTRDTFDANNTTIKRPNKIRELCLQFQGNTSPTLDRILSYFGGLEVLEVNAIGSKTHNHP